VKLHGVLRSLFIFSAITASASLLVAQRTYDDTVVAWNNLAIKTATRNNARGLLMVRALAIMHTAMYDAWAQYDAAAVPTREDSIRRPEAERTVTNKREAVSYAAFRVLVDLFPEDTPGLERQMLSLGYDPAKTYVDRATPSGIGLLAADHVLQYRHHDGANQLGDLHPGAYSDYTGYTSVNTSEVIHDPDRWQPLKDEVQGKSSTQSFFMPQWGRVQPFGFNSVSEVWPQTTPKTLRGDPAGYILQAKDLVELTNSLTERQKVIAEYWELSEGPGTNFILWNQFAQFVAQRDHDQLDDEVKLFFALNNGMFDTSIAVWNTKRYWDSERPVTAIATLSRMFHGYIFHDDWQPYLPTPPFPDFVSSHSAISASAAEVLRRFTRNDEFGFSYTRRAGVSGIEGKPGPTHDVVLTWATFTEAADESGMSRRYGGVHFEDADLEGRALGRRVATLSWNKAQSYIAGTETAKPAPVHSDRIGPPLRSGPQPASQLGG
jgi:hypothetical protein